jgi:nucleoside-diphosphate-sugar epimerase
MDKNDFIIGPDDPILITGSGGFIGPKLVESLLDLGFRNLLCLVRPSSKTDKLDSIADRSGRSAKIRIIRGNLLSREDCLDVVQDVKLIYHLAAGRGEKFYPDAYLNSVVTTRNLLEAASQNSNLKRFINVSSFSVYSNTNKTGGRMLDESCPEEENSADRGEAYCFSKVKQDEIVKERCQRFGIPYAIVRPGYVYGPGNPPIPGRVGIGTFGLFLHLGGSNTLPLTYVDNCAEAIALTGLRPGIGAEVFNVVDDNLPSSRKFLRLYKKNVRTFRSVYVPHAMSYLLCYLWEKYSVWSNGQLLPAFNRKRWHAYWKKTRYSNAKLKSRVGWAPRVSTAEGLERYFKSCRTEETRA